MPAGDNDVLWLIGHNPLLSQGGWLYPGHLESRDLTEGHQFGDQLSTRATNAGGIQASGIWSDDTTMWVLQDVVEPETDIPIVGGDKIRAYTLSGFNRDSAKDITLDESNTKPSGLWSDGTTLYTTDAGQKKVFAYTLSSGAHDSDKDFNLFDGGDSLLSDGNSWPAGLWSDGTTMWVTDGDRAVYAYTLAARTGGTYRHLRRCLDHRDRQRTRYRTLADAGVARRGRRPHLRRRLVRERAELARCPAGCRAQPLRSARRAACSIRPQMGSAASGALR